MCKENARIVCILIDFPFVIILRNVDVLVTTAKAANYRFLCVLISTDVAEGDPDADCRNLAVQSLVLLDKSLKKQLQDQQALSMEP